LLRPKEVCGRLGICYHTLREYVRRGWIKPVILESGRWRFREEDVERIAGPLKFRKVILYVRVSSSSQRDDLEKQIKVLEEWAKSNGISDYDILKDVGSG